MNILTEEDQKDQKSIHDKMTKGIEKSHTVKNFNSKHKIKYQNVHPGQWCQLPFEKQNQFAWSCCVNFDKESKVLFIFKI